MKTYEQCKQLRNLILSRAAEVFSYNWGNEFSATQIREIPELIIKSKGFEKINPSNLTESQMTELDFGVWRGGNPMRLIPLWLLPFLTEEVEATSISDGELRTIKREDMNNDHRFGCTAYGVIPCEK